MKAIFPGVKFDRINSPNKNETVFKKQQNKQNTKTRKQKRTKKIHKTSTCIKVVFWCTFALKLRNEFKGNVVGNFMKLLILNQKNQNSNSDKNGGKIERHIEIEMNSYNQCTSQASAKNATKVSQENTFQIKSTSFQVKMNNFDKWPIKLYWSIRHHIPPME